MGTEDKQLRLVLRTALEAALEAGDYFRSRFATELVVHTKTSISDLVTDVDPHCERLIHDRIRTSFPDHHVLGEESVGPGHDAAVTATREILADEAVWIVDPLDGTTNFVHAIPLSVVSIAFACQGRIQVGVVCDPYRGEVFYSVRGQGAYLADKSAISDWISRTGESNPGMKLAVSRIHELERAVISTGLPMRHAERDVMMERTMPLITRAKSLRTLGAAALQLAYVAAGRIDVFWEYELNAWDVAAGVLLIEEAGGTVEDLDGQPYSLVTRDIIASGGREVIQIIQDALASEK
ncbi:inositol monophosphatase family protein [Alicyclobacillus dauci]|uniref:Inositol-1-monophosphatase n=1 Tax=Alicyclobacillus dauci TaxID=1475485 RepID=A0ABY6YYZ8_9BACL|nr:inositol monophosphatase family protein [Alicyclobacillus dauci]WAH35806.1 inositol monophosphatase [Alicyclobacillus dauci]